MKSKLTASVVAVAACAALEVAAMPTEEEAKRAEPVVRRMLASEKAALAAGQQRLRSEVRAAAVPRIAIGLFKLTVGCRRASASTLAALARLLACTIEDLME